jgi:hypothetical protein
MQRQKAPLHNSSSYAPFFRNAATFKQTQQASAFHHLFRADGALGPRWPTAVSWKNKKADAAKYPEVFHRVGLLINQPLGINRVAVYLVFRCR